MFKFSVDEALRQWPTDNTQADYQPAGNAMAKALRALGITEDAHGASSNVSIRTQPSDGYNVSVNADDAERYARELWKDTRVIEVKIDGTPFAKPIKKTVEDVEKELADFKKKVVAVALRTKREEEWCDSGFERAMKELGLEIPSTKVRITLDLDLADYDTDLTADSPLEQFKNFLHWDIESSEIGDAVKSVEPIKG
ncbi:hypothetical protein [Micromonospora sp. CB01531]|uniref:hypothetical protein n=1 Tax=Micromonospora sp. CB01531 TaxID=1718947 RepID=UPI00093EB44B|nr:hypothetical protein [Micromonospora sp. CB01531]OKI54537.1 hypothetical protein A6A27_31930 [Micromonospora sp. CB01531]